MVDVTYLLHVNIGIFDHAFLTRDSKLVSIPNKGNKILFVDRKLIIKEITYCDNSQGIVIELESTNLKESLEESLEEFCEKYGFEKLHTD